MVSEEEKPVLDIPEDQNPATMKQRIGSGSFAVAPPPPLNVLDQSKLAENWKTWKQTFDDFSILSNLQGQSHERQLAMFRYSLGEKARSILNTLNVSKEDLKNPSAVIEAFERYCLGYSNETFERFKFFKRDQLQGESIDQYVTCLKEISRSCNFCNCMRESLIRDRIILGVAEETTTKRLIKCRQLTLEQCINICRGEEAAGLRMQHLGLQKGEAELNSLEQKRSSPCSFCGLRHQPSKEKCPAWGKTCAKCKKLNHFARQCRSVPVQSVEQAGDTEKEEFMLNGVHQNPRCPALWAEVLVCGRPRRFQLDSGAAVNIIPLD